MTKFVERSFVNEWDQTIEPGDQVICLSTSAGEPSIYKAVYLGVLVNSAGEVVRQRVRRYPGKRYVKTGNMVESATYKNRDGSPWRYEEWAYVDDPEYFTTHALYLGRIFKL